MLLAVVSLVVTSLLKVSRLGRDARSAAICAAVSPDADALIAAGVAGAAAAAAS